MAGGRQAPQVRVFAAICGGCIGGRLALPAGAPYRPAASMGAQSMRGSTVRKVATVFGGTGFIGRYVVQRLANMDYVVRVATSHPNAGHFLPERRRRDRVGSSSRYRTATGNAGAARRFAYLSLGSQAIHSRFDLVFIGR